MQYLIYYTMQNEGKVIKEFKTRISILSLREDSILQIDFMPNQKIEKYDINQLLRAVYKIGNGKRLKSLVTIGESNRTDPDAMKLNCGMEGSMHKTATAFVIENFRQRLVEKFRMNFIKPQHPTRFFSNKAQAEIWLHSIEENN